MSFGYNFRTSFKESTTFQLNDPGVMKFVLSHAQDYFKKMAKEIAQQTIEMDTFARSAQNEATNRERLLTMIDTHLDFMHYVNDILTIKNEELVRQRGIDIQHLF